jgi:hypothetical protein
MAFSPFSSPFCSCESNLAFPLPVLSGHAASDLPQAPDYFRSTPGTSVRRRLTGGCTSRGGIELEFGSCSTAENTARHSRNRRQEGLTAEYAEYAENGLLPGSPSAYSAYSAVASGVLGVNPDSALGESALPFLVCRGRRGQPIVWIPVNCMGFFSRVFCRRHMQELHRL